MPDRSSSLMGDEVTVDDRRYQIRGAATGMQGYRALDINAPYEAPYQWVVLRFLGGRWQRVDDGPRAPDVEERRRQLIEDLGDSGVMAISPTILRQIEDERAWAQEREQDVQRQREATVPRAVRVPDAETEFEAALERAMAEESFAELTAPEVQGSLLPEERIEPTGVLSVALDVIDVPQSLEPGADLVASIRLLGVFQPVALVRRGRRFIVAEGKRRVKAALAAGLTAIPAIVFPEHTPTNVISAMTLTGNMIRRPNPLAELEAIESLVAAGGSEQMIAREMSLSLQTLRARMRLAHLIPELRSALSEGLMAPTVAELAARLDSGRQETLANALVGREEEFGGNPRTRWRIPITAREVRTLRQAVTAEQVTAIPDAVFATPSARVGASDDALIAESRITGDTFFNTYGVLIHEGLRYIPETMHLQEIGVLQTRNVQLLAEVQILNARLAEPRPPIALPIASGGSTFDESWESVDRLVGYLQSAVPSEPGPDSDRIAAMLDDLREIATRRAAANTRQRRSATMPPLTPEGAREMIARQDGTLSSTIVPARPRRRRTT